ncbi:MAG TPA: phosphoglucosamine mutase [Anaerohalosphaeraceae bacterium]|nr:phosphoglucosamine mutase [Phycisphaerae bacterium]HOL30631.1 phosphoglucosamine mutase [Anaerohalosphaeraceae bacterium]HOM75296.1 phosphoglucosamine mutase [Anaerohalosphaeraceae bacterium]HPC63104.1 phosphoglucosamine mutase [Anaerohalosphaeraceae bacterium]HPO69926.1 phosphoglucosamine mutase [Anaerohalosphaeraceae bacterium]
MAQELIISISGMRGLVGHNLFPNTAADYGSAFGTFLKRQCSSSGRCAVAIGRDSRPSGQMLFSAVASGLTAAGADVIDLGICSTPGVGIMVRHLGCAGGVVITASHNPAPYNGIKLLLGNGIAPPKPTAEQIIQLFRSQQFERTDALGCGTICQNRDTHQVHLEKVLAIVQKESIIPKHFRVVLDSVNGAGGTAGQMLLEALGCQVICMNAEPTGRFAHAPEPTAENLTALCRQVAAEKADIGFAQDPDADRLAIVDEKGVYIGEEFTLALAAKQVFSRKKGAAAANLSTSRMIDDIASAAGCRVIRTPVGEAHVANAMIEHNCVIGGEGNGGIIDLRVGPVRDSLVGMALVLQLMADAGKSVSQLAAEVGGYCMYKTKYSADTIQAQAVIEKAKSLFADALINTRDGCRLDLPDGWIHIRTSNTEPIMRVIIEAKEAAAADRYAKQIERICGEVIGK